MGNNAEKKRAKNREGREERHTQFPQDSWTEIDAEGTDSEMAQGRESDEPFYTPLVSEAAERKLKDKKKASREKGDRQAA